MSIQVSSQKVKKRALYVNVRYISQLFAGPECACKSHASLFADIIIVQARNEKNNIAMMIVLVRVMKYRFSHLFSLVTYRR